MGSATAAAGSAPTTRSELDLIAGAALTADGLVAPARISIAGDRITSVTPAPAGAQAMQGTLVPGFVDLQVNGIDDVDVATAEGAAWERLDALLLDQGVTTWCPTLVTAPLESYAAPLARVAEAARRSPEGRPRLAGAHLEGPFLGGAPGAHPPRLLRDPDPEWLAALPPIVRIVTLAPERNGAAAATRELAARGVVVSLGHSDTDFATAIDGFAVGATMVTHLFNAMAPLHHRRPGLAGAALSTPGVVAGLIVDLVHVHPALVATAFATKGADGIALVTDAVAWRAARVGRIEISLVDGAPRLADGTLAGSALTMDAAIRNTVAAGVDLVDAVRSATATPAGVLGLGDRGVLEPGRLADLVLLGPDLTVDAVWVGGERVR